MTLIFFIQNRPEVQKVQLPRHAFSVYRCIIPDETVNKIVYTHLQLHYSLESGNIGKDTSGLGWCSIGVGRGIIIDKVW